MYKEECTEFLKSLGLEGWGDQKLEVWTTFFFNPPKRSKFDYPASVGDCDNLVKLVWDCCTDAGLWDDDRQIIRSHEEKHFTDGQARTEITIEPIQDEL